MELNTKQIISTLEDIINKPEITEEEKSALTEACRLIQKKGTEGYMEALKWIMLILDFCDNHFH